MSCTPVFKWEEENVVDDGVVVICCCCCRGGEKRRKEIMQNIYGWLDRKRNRCIYMKWWSIKSDVCTYKYVQHSNRLAINILLRFSPPLSLLHRPPHSPFKHRWWLTMLPQLTFASTVRSIPVICKRSNSIWRVLVELNVTLIHYLYIQVHTDTDVKMRHNHNHQRTLLPRLINAMPLTMNR